MSGPGPSDSHMIQALKTGAIESLKPLYERYQPILVKTLWLETQDQARAEDLAQECFLRIWRNRQNLQADTSVLAYLIQIGRNLIKDEYKHLDVRIRHQAHVESISQHPNPTPQQAFQLNQLQARIWQVVQDDLPDKCRIVFVLSRFEGKSNGEIAEMLGITKKTVENQLYQALKVLRQKCRDLL